MKKSQIQDSNLNQYKGAANQEFTKEVVLSQYTPPTFQLKNNSDNRESQEESSFEEEQYSKSWETCKSSCPPADEIPQGSQSMNAGLPGGIKAGIEHYSGVNMSEVNVHYNSNKPAQLKAHAYAQGSSIHLAPGQEQHLAHEAWHVVQQKQNRVQATTQLKSDVPINDDENLEREADLMGNKVKQFAASGEINNKRTGPYRLNSISSNSANVNQPVQRYAIVKQSKQKTNFWQGANRDLKVSDDGKMAIHHMDGVPEDSNGFQTLYATPDIIQHSQQVLANVGSGVTMVQSGNTISGKPPGDKKAPPQTLYRVDFSNQDLARHGSADHSFNACSANMQNVLGILRLSATDKDDRKIVRDVTLKLEGSIDHDKKTINTSHDLSLALAEANKVISGKPDETEARNAVRAFSKSVMKVKAKEYGLNEHALPDVGEGWAIKQGGQGGEKGYGHFAPVIAKSGNDRVTMENDVSQKKNLKGTLVGQINPDWYLRMFGPVKKLSFGRKDDQSFYGQALKHEQEDFGDAPFVARIGSTQKT